MPDPVRRVGREAQALARARQRRAGGVDARPGLAVGGRSSQVEAGARALPRPDQRSGVRGEHAVDQVAGSPAPEDAEGLRLFVDAGHGPAPHAPADVAVRAAPVAADRQRGGRRRRRSTRRPCGRTRWRERPGRRSRSRPGRAGAGAVRDRRRADPDQHVLAGRGQHLGHRAGREVDRDEADGGGTGSTGGAAQLLAPSSTSTSATISRPSDSRSRRIRCERRAGAVLPCSR